MLIPISWLKDYVEIKLPLKDLMWKMTEAGLTCESSKKIGGEIILDVEVTANRPDWMSILGVAREIAAIQGVKIKEPKIKTLPKKSGNFPIDLNIDYSLFERWTGIVLKDVEIKPSPKWLADRIKLMGHSPINNVIDVTNYVMYELGIPMHAFDYDEIHGQVMTVGKSTGREEFTSVDELSYKLPKNAIIIRDADRLIDLAGIKGGLNSGIKNTTKNIFLHVTIDNPSLVRRTSITLGLRSEASAIYERRPDVGGTVKALTRAVNLINELAGGKVASKIIDLKKHDYKPWLLEVKFANLENVLGIKLADDYIIKILDKLNLNPKKNKDLVICLIPTYRGDLKIEEDLIEEVARIHGYNKFPQTLPSGTTTKAKIPYYFDDTFNLKLKELAITSGLTEVKTLSLISKDLIDKFNLIPKNHVKLINPVSNEYEYMRSSLIPSLSLGLSLNPQNKVLIFEIEKVYPTEEYKFSAVTKGLTFRTFKGILDLTFDRLNIKNYKIEFETNKNYLHPSKAGSIVINSEVIGDFGSLSPQVMENISQKEEILVFELDVKTLQKHITPTVFRTPPANPPQIEDLTLSFPSKTRIGEVIQSIESVSSYVSSVELIDTYKDTYTLRLNYQHPEKTLTNTEVDNLRDKILKITKKKFGGSLKN